MKYHVFGYTIEINKAPQNSKSKIRNLKRKLRILQTYIRMYEYIQEYIIRFTHSKREVTKIEVEVERNNVFDNLFDEKRNAYKWLYMPAASSHFEGEKLYLFVDKEGTLVGWKLIE